MNPYECPETNRDDRCDCNRVLVPHVFLIFVAFMIGFLGGLIFFAFFA